MKIVLAVLTVICASMISLAQDSGSEVISRAHALEDLKILSISLREIHPSIYRYTPKSIFDSAFTSAERSLGRTITLRDFNNLVTTISTATREK